MMHDAASTPALQNFNEGAPLWDTRSKHLFHARAGYLRHPRYATRRTAIVTMLITEYRIPFPSTLEEYRIGMMYMISRASEEETRRARGKGGVEVLKNEIYIENDHGMRPGVYTEKVFHVRRMLPRFLRYLVPESKSTLLEKSWNAFPEHCLTIYESPFLGDGFHLSVESRYIGNDNGTTENALGLNEADLKARKVVLLDMASEEHLRLSPETNVRETNCKTRAQPKLDGSGAWIRTAAPIMCCYKVCRLEVSKRGLPARRIEQWGQRFGLQASFLRFNRQALCWMDAWLGLDARDIAGMSGGTVLATEIAAESNAGLALFSSSDETNPFS